MNYSRIVVLSLVAVGCADGPGDRGPRNRGAQGDALEMPTNCEAEEICFDGVDNDCDGWADCEDAMCRTECRAECAASEVCTDGVDNDCDEMPDCEDPECMGHAACPGLARSPRLVPNRQLACAYEILGDVVTEVEGTNEELIVRPAGAPCTYEIVHRLGAVEHVVSSAPGAHLFFDAEHDDALGTVVCLSNLQHSENNGISDQIERRTGVEGHIGLRIDSVSVECAVRQPDGTWTETVTVAPGTASAAMWLNNIEASGEAFEVAYLHDFSFQPFNPQHPSRPETDGMFTRTVDVDNAGTVVAGAPVRVAPARPEEPNVGETPLMGDLDANGVLDEADIPLFVHAIEDPEGFEETYGDSPTLRGADVNGDGTINGYDLDLAFPGHCVPGDARCSLDGARVETCPSGTWREDTECGEGTCVQITDCGSTDATFACRAPDEIFAQCPFDEARSCQCFDPYLGVDEHYQVECAVTARDDQGNPTRHDYVKVRSCSAPDCAGCSGPPLGDFVHDGEVDGEHTLDSADIDELVRQIVAGTDNAEFDLSGDGVVDQADIDAWLALAGPANGWGGPLLRGDANCDGFVDGSDFNALAVHWGREAEGWSRGDFIADGVVDASDFNALAVNWFQSAPSP